MPVVSGAQLALVKYEGAGNDFLVCIDLDGDRPVSPAEVRALCDRHHGVGADGLVRVLAGPAGSDVRMELHNADGSRAEMSGNGVRCLAHAVLDAHLVEGAQVVVATDAGTRRVTVRPRPGDVVADGEVAMGAAGLGAELGPVELAGLARGDGPTGPGVRARRVDMGNPHLVVVVPHLDRRLLPSWARAVDEATPGGTNVELVAVRADGGLDLAVWERGAGETLACGTGSCAAAAACAAWGLVTLPVVVHNPGGPLRVDRRDGQLVLGGPSRRVAEVLVPEASLGVGGPPGADWPAAGERAAPPADGDPGTPPATRTVVP